MLQTIIKTNELLNPLRRFSDKVFVNILDLVFRLYVAEDFLRSGIGRAKDYLAGNWDTQIFLFELEHPVPLLSPQIAAPITTLAELILPLLLILGLFTRIGAAGIFIMALIIQLTYQENFQHLLWMSMMAAVFIRGPGIMSIDHLIVKWAENNHEKKNKKN